MGRLDPLFEAVTEHSRIVIALMLVLTVIVGAGAGSIDQSSSLDQFQSDTEESQKLSYIESNFSTDSENTTSTQLIVRDDNVLDKETLVGIIELEQRLQANETVSKTLVENNSVVGVSNIVATAAIQREIGGELQQKAARFERLNATVTEESAQLERERVALQERRTELNDTADRLQGALDTIRADRNADIRTQFEQVQANSSVDISDDYATFETAAEQLRNATSRDEIEAAYTQGTQGVLADQFTALRQRGAELEDRGQELQTKATELKELGQEVASLQAELEANANPSLDTQLEQLRSMNQSEIDATLSLVFGSNSDSGGAFGFMPTSFDPDSGSANATMLIVSHTTDGSGGAGAAPDRIVDAQLAMQTITSDTDDGSDVLVFGVGIISDEINRSMADSLAIVGPLALLFVVLALVIAYRDFVDIVLGVFGIGVVLVWTFGFMGWAEIPFNQMMIAVPVLLIGLSIDYAIHIFMRHREERNNRHTASDVRGAMRVGLVGVGVALLFVTATTVIGFLANLTSPIPPIKDFGVVSAVGISAAMLVFGALVPALKIEIDEFLEGRFDLDRKKEAFGTGGGRFGDVLAAGATAARKAPYVVIVLALLVSAGGAYGAAQVDTSFNQEDFLAQDPPEITKDLPGPLATSDYTAKDNLEYVNENFLREDSQAQILVEGDIANAETLRKLDAARSAAAEKDSVQVLSNGEPDIQGPLSVMETVAAENESFNATFQNADTDGDGVPDRNLDEVYAQLFETAPDQAGGVIYQSEDGDYAAARLVISVKGGASSTAVTEDMRAIAGDINGNGLEATATGQTILFKIVQDNLLQTVIESLIITLIAVVAFLMLTYRLTEGSATLGFVTILPVILSVSWILGTMFVLGIPFNILTGMITSLTVGLGVAYSIHLSERYNQELERADSMWEAMQTSVTGTGGALLGSAATTVGGFGVLAFAILPPLQQFGIITGITIIYAFLASVLVLPSLLVVWTRYVGPDEMETVESTPSAGEVPAED